VPDPNSHRDKLSINEAAKSLKTEFGLVGRDFFLREQLWFFWFFPFGGRCSGSALLPIVVHAVPKHCWFVLSSWMLA
jgi:hypothetical protein